MHWDWSLATPPGRQQVVEYLMRLKNPQPGGDGIPNAAWANGGDASVDYLDDLLNLTRQKRSVLRTSTVAYLSLA